jgi:hypothetical protein
MAWYDHIEAGVVGLASSPAEFRCGTCGYYKSGECYNPNPKLYEKKVEPSWCCNLYTHDGMKIIIA